ncbi:MAG: Uma2 family endonuclease [Isosphaeraceae bacterium]|nr:Uma2 family endonuclease [Isosphaeraceae bacterium]
MATTSRVAPPPLVEGDRLDQPEFHRRYEAMPPGTRAELIGGVVSMPSPVGPEHSRAHVLVIVWLDRYAEATPGVEVLDNASTALDLKGELQPDAQLRILPECGGQTRTEQKIIVGAPELVVEVAQSTRYVDLGPKLADYERAGVREYIVRALDPDEVIWHVRREGRLMAIPPGPEGLYRSEVFPGLWLDPQALLAGDRAAVRAALERGLATPEHAAFLARLAAARGMP